MPARFASNSSCQAECDSAASVRVAAARVGRVITSGAGDSWHQRRTQECFARRNSETSSWDVSQLPDTIAPGQSESAHSARSAPDLKVAVACILKCLLCVIEVGSLGLFSASSLSRASSHDSNRLINLHSGSDTRISGFWLLDAAPPVAGIGTARLRSAHQALAR
jgi:hypothetical protein